MQDVTLQQLLEAGCHFGHKSERWNPKAAQFIYTEKDGIHIIDLAKTKTGLEDAMKFVNELVASGSEILFVGTKRQVKSIVKDEALRVHAPYIVERWIGGFLTNWDGIHKNIQKIIRLSEEETNGAWKKFPKHEQSKLSRYLRRLKVFYGGVLTLNTPPQALFIVDVKKEIAAVREGLRCGIPIVAIVDTNADPTGISHVIPANDDAVGSVTILTHALASAYEEGRATAMKLAEDTQKAAEKQAAAAKAKEEEKTAVKKVEPTEDIAKDVQAELANITEEKPKAVKKVAVKKAAAKKTETK